MYIVKLVKKGVGERMLEPCVHIDVCNLQDLKAMGRQLDGAGNPIPGTAPNVPDGAGIRLQLRHADKRMTEVHLPRDADVAYVMAPTKTQARTVASYRWPPAKKRARESTKEDAA